MNKIEQLPLILNPAMVYCDYNIETGEPQAVTSDDVLLSQIAGGDQMAFNELYQRYNRSLYCYLLRLVREPSDAEDLLQEVFVAAWRGAGGYRGQAQVRTWLYRIAHHRAVSWLRKRKPVLAFDYLTETSQGLGAEEPTLDTWQNEQLRKAIDSLPLKQREVLELAFVHNFSYPEIARVINCPQGTVKSRMSYAIRSLNGLLSRMNFSK